MVTGSQVTSTTRYRQPNAFEFLTGPTQFRAGHFEVTSTLRHTHPFVPGQVAHSNLRLSTPSFHLHLAKLPRQHGHARDPRRPTFVSTSVLTSRRTRSAPCRSVYDMTQRCDPRILVAAPAAVSPWGQVHMPQNWRLSACRATVACVLRLHDRMQNRGGEPRRSETLPSWCRLCGSLFTGLAANPPQPPTGNNKW